MSSYIIDLSKLVEIFCEVDDFCKEHEKFIESRAVGKAERTPGPACSLSESEILTLMIFYHYSGMRHFKSYYLQFVPMLKDYFPGICSYSRFVELIPKHLFLAWCFSIYKCSQSKLTGTYYIDSKQLPICDIRRAGQNKVFKDVAAKGKSSTGWFYGFKLHIVINHKGEIVRFLPTPANVADNNEKVLHYLLDSLQGSCYGDKGYLSRLFGWFYENGLHLFARQRNNMKKLPAFAKDAILSKARGIVESVNALFVRVMDMDHTRHRKAENAFAHIFSGIAAYAYYNTKPSIKHKYIMLG